MPYNKTKYNNDYNKNNYERLNILVKKGMKEYIEKRAKNNYGSINQYVNALINKDLDSNDYANAPLNSEEQFIINQYRFGTDEARKTIYLASIKADEINSNYGKDKIYNERVSENKTNIINMGDNNGTINM